MQQAINNVQKLAEQLKSEMEKFKNSISPDKLTEPDVQAALNDAVQCAAMKGEKTDLNLLANLVVNRINSGNSEFIDLTLEQAIKIVPKLTKSQLNFLTVKHYLSHMHYQHPDLNYLHLEAFAKLVLQDCADSCILSESNMRYLVGVGVLTYNPPMRHKHTVWELLYEAYKALAPDKLLFQMKAQKHAPSLCELAQIYEKNHFPYTILNSFGQAIAVARLGKIWEKLMGILLKPLDLERWIN